MLLCNMCIQGDSDASEFDRSDGFTQALQKLQDASQAVMRPPVLAAQAHEQPTCMAQGVSMAPAASTEIPNGPVAKSGTDQARVNGDTAARKRTDDVSKAKQAAAEHARGAEAQTEAELLAGTDKRAKAGAGKGSKAKASGKNKDAEQKAKGQKQQKAAPKQKAGGGTDMHAHEGNAAEPPVEKPPTRKRRRQAAAQADKPEDVEQDEPKAPKKPKVQ